MTQQILSPLSLMLLNMKYYIPYYLIAPRRLIISRAILQENIMLICVNINIMENQIVLIDL